METINCNEIKIVCSRIQNELDQKVLSSLWQALIEVFYEITKDKYDFKNFKKNVLSKNGEPELKKRLKLTNARTMTMKQASLVELTTAMEEKVKEIFGNQFDAVKGILVAFRIQDENYKLGLKLKELDKELGMVKKDPFSF